MTNRRENRINTRSWYDDSELWDASIKDLVASCPETAAETVPLVIYVDDTVWDPWLRPRRHLDFMSLYIARVGRGTHVIDGVPYPVVRGDVYAMRPGMSHKFVDTDQLVLDTIHFSPDIFDDATVDALTSTPGFTSLFIEEPLNRSVRDATDAKWLHLSPSGYATAAEMFGELRREWENGTPSGTLLTSGLFLRLLIFLSREYSAGHSGSVEPSAGCGSRMPQARLTGCHGDTAAMAVRYIDEHFANPVRVDELASSFFLSPGRFAEVFRSQMGCSPRDYLTHVRLEHAKTLLAATDLPITAVAGQCGFLDPAHFTRQFRTRIGRSPRNFRTGK